MGCDAGSCSYDCDNKPQKILRNSIPHEIKANKGKIEPGCEVIVPSKGPKKEMTTAQWIGIGSSVASLGTMFATIANLIKK